MHQKATTDHVVIVRAQEAREEDIPVLAYNADYARLNPLNGKAI
jgi:hypothetical protein